MPKVFLVSVLSLASCYPFPENPDADRVGMSESLYLILAVKQEEKASTEALLMCCVTHLSTSKYCLVENLNLGC